MVKDLRIIVERLEEGPGVFSALRSIGYPPEGQFEVPGGKRRRDVRRRVSGTSRTIESYLSDLTECPTPTLHGGVASGSIDDI